MVITRFAPSPTGLLHVGNIRTALINWLFTRHHGGKFMLRMDDTDKIRSKEEYADAIERELRWLGLEWDLFAKQSDRIERYEEVKEELIQAGRLYPCYESPEELEMKRKLQLNRGMAPIYDRWALKLSDEQKKKFIDEGKKPHYRFLLKDEEIIWQDNIRGQTVFAGKNLSDPILIREDGSMTYILCSVIDDIDFAITHVIRGEDHVTNTAIQIQIFDALASIPPSFAHLNLIQSKNEEISKRLGGFDIATLRAESIEAMTINSFLATIGTSKLTEARKSLEDLVKDFDITKFSRAPANYDKEELLKLNHKLINLLSFSEVKEKLSHLPNIDESFWLAVRPNINKLSEIEIWWKICRDILNPVIEDAEFLKQASTLLPEMLDEGSWDLWIKLLKEATNRSGKNLFMPIRKAITAQDNGPELKLLLPLIGREKIIKRLNGESA